MSRFGKTVAVMHAAVTSPRTITSVRPAEGCGVASGKYFDSDRLLVKHDADYKDYDEKNPERLDGDESNDT